MAGYDNRLCKNAGDPTAPAGCLGTPDEQFTMDFTDVEPGAYIRWCAVCGPLAHRINRALQKALDTRGPEFAKKLDAEISKYEPS